MAIAAKLDDYAKQTCVASKKITVLPAEICTMDTALKLGIADKDNYFKPGYGSLKSLNKDFDDRDSARFNKLCYQSLSTNDAYKNCVIEHGMPFTRKKGDMTKCVPAECPPGFETTLDGCKKPMVGDSTLLTSHCDERWYDWFTVPYYHLGNKYQAGDEDGKCLEPCKVGYIPGYAKDPVDGASMDLTSKDELNTCINKYNYFGGKYKESSDFCPIALVKRLGTTKDDLRSEFIDRVNKVENKNTRSVDIIQSIVPGEVEDIYKKLTTTSSDIEFPTGDVLKACRKVHTEDRLADTYTICRNLSTNADSFTEKFVRDGLGVEEAKIKTNILKKACHTLFCNKQDDASTVIAGKVWPENSCTAEQEDCENRITGEPICFVDVEKINFQEDLKKLNAAAVVNYPEVSSDASKIKLNNSLKWMIYCIVIPVGAVIAWGIWTQLLWPYIIRPLWRLLVKLLTGYRKSALQDKAEKLLENIENIIPSKPKK